MVMCAARWLGTPGRCSRTPRCRGWWSCATGRRRPARGGAGQRDPQLLELWMRTPTGRDDYEASRQLITTLEREDPRRAGERARLRRLSQQRREG